MSSLASLAFIYAFKLTYVANVAVIYATAPFMAAGLGWWLLRETRERRTLVAALVSIVGVNVVVLGGLGTGKLGGDAVALLMTLGNALFIGSSRILFRCLGRTRFSSRCSASPSPLLLCCGRKGRG